MAKDNRRFGPADQAAVVTALARGATIAAAAREAGFAKRTLYDARNRCGLFREAWDAAVAESARPLLVVPRGGRRWQLQRMRGNRFTTERKEAYLAHFAATCDTLASAEAAGVSDHTVYDHRRRDPAFREAWQEALEQGYARLEAEALRQRLAAIEKLRVVADEKAAPALAKMVADEFERAIVLLREYKKSLGIGGRTQRTLTKWSFEAAFEALEKELKVFGYRAGKERREASPDLPPPDREGRGGAEAGPGEDSEAPLSSPVAAPTQPLEPQVRPRDEPESGSDLIAAERLAP